MRSCRRTSTSSRSSANRSSTASSNPSMAVSLSVSVTGEAAGGREVGAGLPRQGPLVRFAAVGAAGEFLGERLVGVAVVGHRVALTACGELMSGDGERGVGVEAERQGAGRAPPHDFPG